MKKQDLNLKDINRLLPEITNKLIKARKVKDKAEVKYYSCFYKTLLSDNLTGYRHQDMRKAEAKKICETEGLADPMYNAKGKHSDLYIERETLIEIARNLRSLSY